MAIDEIVEKLKSFVLAHCPPKEESDVVYLMVEMRKIIDKRKKEYPLLKFYADWAVHSEKDRITPEIERISEELYSTAVTEIESAFPGMSGTKSPMNAFAYMEELGKEMLALFREFGIETAFVEDRESWIQFVALLVKVLENQPINNPSKNVQTIYFEPANEGCVIGIIIFKKPVNGYEYYKYMNVF